MTGKDGLGKGTWRDVALSFINTTPAAYTFVFHELLFCLQCLNNRYKEPHQYTSTSILTWVLFR